MNSFERLEDEACNDGIDIIDYEFKNEKIKGLYCDNSIGINKNIKTSAERSCILAEELGHHHTSIGNILNMNNIQNRKQERQARLWGYNKLIGLTGIINAFESGCQSIHDAAEFLEVTEEYFIEAIKCYRGKYGVSTEISEYTIYFIPQLAVFKRI